MSAESFKLMGDDRTESKKNDVSAPVDVKVRDIKVVIESCLIKLLRSELLFVKQSHFGITVDSN